MEERSSKGDDEVDVYALGREKIATGEQLLKRLDAFKQIDGVSKIKRKISSEIASLQRVRLTHSFVETRFHFSFSVFDRTGDSHESIENQSHSVQ